MAENFFPPSSHEWCRKKIVPHICLGRYWFWICVISTAANISLGWPEPFEARGQETELPTEPEQNHGNQYMVSPLALRDKISSLGHSCQISPSKRNQVTLSIVTKLFSISCDYMARYFVILVWAIFFMTCNPELCPFPIRANVFTTHSH